MKVVNIDHGELLLLPVDAMFVGFGHMAANQVPDSKRSRVEACRSNAARVPEAAVAQRSTLMLMKSTR